MAEGRGNTGTQAMIEAISSVKNATTRVTEAPEPDPKPVPARDPITPEAGKTKVQPTAAPEEVAAPSPSFDVKLDTKTLRMYSEILDPATGHVVSRLPAGYQPKGEHKVASAGFERTA
jgi:hypothetical protein